MTTGKLFRISKIIFIVLIIFLFSLSAVSCWDEDKEDDDTYKYLFSDINSALANDEEKIDKYTVIVAKGCSARIYEAANGICNKIKDKTGIYSELCYDNEYVESTKKVCKVLVGKSKYTDAFLRDYKIDDYGYCCLESTVFVGGISEKATLEAISKFNDDILSRDGKSFIKESDSFRNDGEYEIEHVELNGVELGEYVIVYDADNTAAYSEALLFRDKIVGHTGYYLNILRDSACSGQTKAICIGSTSLNDMDNGIYAENEARIIPYPNGFSVVADTGYGLKLGVSKLSDILLEKNDSRENYAEIDTDICISFSKTNLEIVDIDLSESLLSFAEMLDILNLIYVEEYDFIRIYGVSDELIHYFSGYCSDVYETNRVIDGDEGIYYLHLKEKYTLESVANIGMEGLDAVHTLYTAKVGYAKIDMLELYPHERDNESFANSAAELVVEFLENKDMRTVMIGSAFEGAAENIFADKIAPVSSVSAILGALELIENRVYLAGAAFELGDCNAEKCYTAQLYFTGLTIYGK